MLRLIVLALLVSSSAHAGWFGYDSYDDCMLDKMKGQSQSMYLNAHKLCAKRMGLEKEISTSDVQIGWDKKQPWELTFNVASNTSEYNITRGEFSFSDRPCEQAKPDDFGERITVTFAADTAKAPIVSYESKCMKTIKLWGKYK